MISWVTQEDWHGQKHPLEFKFDVSMCGVLGVGYDITKWTDKEKETAREKIALYKEIRETVHKGDHYRLVSLMKITGVFYSLSISRRQNLSCSFIIWLSILIM